MWRKGVGRRKKKGNDLLGVSDWISGTLSSLQMRCFRCGCVVVPFFFASFLLLLLSPYAAHPFQPGRPGASIPIWSMKDARGEMGKKEDAAYKRNPKNRKNVGRNVERLVENNYIPTSAAAKRAPPLYTERSERTRQDGRLDAGRRTSIHYYSGTNNRHQQVTPLSGSRTSSHGCWDAAAAVAAP